MDDSDGVFAINCKIAKAQQTAKETTLPKTERDDAFLGFFGCDPLEQKTDPKHRASGKANNLPCVDFQWVKFKA